MINKRHSSTRSGLYRTGGTNCTKNIPKVSGAANFAALHALRALDLETGVKKGAIIFHMHICLTTRICPYMPYDQFFLVVWEVIQKKQSFGDTGIYLYSRII